MRIDTNAINITLSREQREYARTRLWSATRVAAGRVAWAGLWLTAPQSAAQGTVIECRITVWLKGTGPVSVSHSAADALAAIDLAAARLKHAIRSHLPANRTRLRMPRARRTRRASRQTQRGLSTPVLPTTRERAGCISQLATLPESAKPLIYEGR